MFRKFKQGLAQAGAALRDGLSTDEERKINSLVSMGFQPDQARNALRACNGDAERAAELLLAGGVAGGGGGSGGSYQPQQQQRQHQQQQQQVQHNNNAANDVDLQRAMQESLEEEELRLIREAQMASKQEQEIPVAGLTTVRSAASVRAGQAALKRFEEASSPKKKAANTRKKSKSPPRGVKPKVKTPPSSGGGVDGPLIMGSEDFTHSLTAPISSHPNVKVPKKLQDKSKEEQILRCADRLKASPRAVDTLYISLTALQKDPNNEKYRKIDKTNPGYQRSLANAPGAEDMLKAMNFKPVGNNTLVLQVYDIDSALLYLGISALDQTRKKPEYIEAKRKIQFMKEVQQIQQSADSSEAEAIKRSEYMAKCPSEPEEGRGALVQIIVGDDTTLRRRFDGDDTLGDVLNWLGGHGSVIPDKIMVDKEWSLVDLNQYPTRPIDCNMDQDKTLQYIGCWPSGRLEIMPTKEEWATTTL